MSGNYDDIIRQVLSDKQLQDRDLNSQLSALSQQISQMSLQPNRDEAAFNALMDQYDALSQQTRGGRSALRDQQRMNAVPGDVQAIQQGIDRRQQLGRNEE